MATRGWENATLNDVRDRRQPVKRSKYRNVPTTVDGIRFDSAKEARRYGELRVLEKAGDISHLIIQPRYGIYARPLGGDPIHIADYFGDFQYETVKGLVVVEDVKGVKTALYKLKKKFVEAHYGIQIREV